MPKLKRVNEHQIHKDEYDAGGDDRFAEAPDPGRGMNRASQDVLQKRKILKVSRSKFGAASAQVAPTSRPAASSNPFASTTLAPPTTMPTPLASTITAGDGPPSKPNPFANTTFVSNAISAKFSFGSASSASLASIPKPAFGSNSNNAMSSSTTFSLAAETKPPKNGILAPQSTKGIKGRTRELNENVALEIVRHWEGRHHAADYSPFFKEYEQLGEMLERENDAGSNRIEATATKAAAPDPAPVTVSFSSGTAAAPPREGAFAFASTPAAGAKSALSFSFGRPPTSSAGSAHLAVTGATDDNTPKPDDGKVETVEQEVNSQEETLFEVRAKNVKFVDKEWKKFGAGVLRLYRHKTNDKCRMVIRNQIGKVQFNVGVSKGMTFEKVRKTTKKGEATYVKFLAIEDASKGMEQFMLQIKPEFLDELYTTLERMAA